MAIVGLYGEEGHTFNKLLHVDLALNKYMRHLHVYVMVGTVLYQCCWQQLWQHHLLAIDDASADARTCGRVA